MSAVQENPAGIQQRVLELVRLGLKVRDIAALLGAHPKAIEGLVKQ